MPVSLTNHLTREDAGAVLRADVLAGLTSTPKSLPPRWFYDERGSALFDGTPQGVVHFLDGYDPDTNPGAYEVISFDEENQCETESQVDCWI